MRLGESGAAQAGPVIDLLFAPSGIEGEIAAAATPLEVFPDVRAPVAETGHLLALKRELSAEWNHLLAQRGGRR